MRVEIIAVGRIKPGPEKDLFDNFAKRFDGQGKALSLGPLTLTEVEEKKNLGRAELAAREGEKILQALPKGAKLIVLDERGCSMKSKEFSDKLSLWRDEGAPACAFVIGGAGGLSDEVRNRADFKLSFGSQTWPHMMARVMLCEQLYRAATILAGHPYHRDG
jgi:23S rRNA (pseudouridine1915-N3)-methyltransferase